MEYVWGITLVTRVRGFVKTSTETSRKGGPLNPTRTARRSARRLIFWNVVAWNTRVEPVLHERACATYVA